MFDSNDYWDNHPDHPQNAEDYIPQEECHQQALVDAIGENTSAFDAIADLMRDYHLHPLTFEQVGARFNEIYKNKFLDYYQELESDYLSREGR